MSYALKIKNYYFLMIFTLLIYDNSTQRQVYVCLSEKNVILLSHDLNFQTNEN